MADASFLGGLIVNVVVAAGFLLTLWRLNLRDRRTALLQATIGECLGRELRGAVAVSVRAGVWRSRAHAMVDMRECESHHVWRLIAELDPRLPRAATLSIIISAPGRARVTSIHIDGAATPRGWATWALRARAA